MQKVISLLQFFLPRILFSLLVLFLILFSLELYLRWTSSYVKPSGWTFVTGSDELIVETSLGKRLRPNTDVVIKKHPQSHRDIPIHINSLGFRGSEIPKEKNQTETRILVLGDSITWADGLEEEKTWVHQLQNDLVSTNSGTSYRVINAGVGDIGMKEEVDILSETIGKVHPDHVLLQFYLNDSRPPWGFPNELGYRGFLRHNSVLAETLYREIVLRNWIKEKGIIRGSYWYSLLNQLDWQHNRDDFLKLVHAAQADWGVAWNKDSWNAIDEQLSRLQTLSKQNNFTVTVVAFPVVYQVKSDFIENTPQTILKEKVEKLGINYYDLLPSLRKESQQELFYDYCHYNEAGSRIVAQSIAEFLKNKIL